MLDDKVGAGKAAAAAAATPRNVQVEGIMGFDNFPDQVVNKSIRRGIVFNIMCIGETGIGKSTLMDSLFCTNFGTQPNPHRLTSVQLNANTYELEENNIKMTLTIVDTVGYGDQLNKEDSTKPILDYVDEQFEAYFQEELKIRRDLLAYQDTRIHVCLYFISPTGHGLKSLDLMCMKKLDKKVNIIPLVAKADSLSRQELQKFKERVNFELASNGVRIYNFPIDDEAIGGVNAAMNDHIPFAVIGSNDMVKVGTKLVRGRKYPWGTVEVTNERHCDFEKLRDMLIRTNMEDLREQTHDKHYELYRKTRLEEMGLRDIDYDNKSLSHEQIWKKKMTLFREELAQKEEAIKEKIRQRCKEKETELQEAEMNLQERLERMNKEMDEERKKLEEYQAILEDDMTKFVYFKLHHSQQQQQEQQKLSRSLNTLSRGSLSLNRSKGKKK